ncbi:endo-1,4-beta-xylanase [Paenibacillus polymyxa M1]|nr:endo-1,4-beta-xylanase [Paenibacillus polymyxa M1]
MLYQATTECIASQSALFRKGKKFDETKTHQQIGNISVNYSANYQPNGNSYLCVRQCQCN